MPFDFGQKSQANQQAPLSGAAAEPAYAVDETYWGYVIRSTQTVSLPMVLLQGLSWLVGVAFLVATLGLWLIPGSMTTGAILGMKLAATMVTAAAAVCFLWFASRGTLSEIQVDTRLAEVREVVRNRAGRATLVARYGFDAVEEVALSGPGGDGSRGEARSLVLRHRDMAKGIEIARGSDRGLSRLRERLGQDLMIGRADRRPSPYNSDGSLVSAA